MLRIISRIYLAAMMSLFCGVFVSCTHAEIPQASSNDHLTAIYVSPQGISDAAGTLTEPTTLTSAIDRIKSGGFIYVRGGVYNYSDTVKITRGNDGTAAAAKHIFAYFEEVPILNFSQQPTKSSAKGIVLQGHYWHIKGLIVERAGDTGIHVSGSNNIIERVVTRYNRDTGLQLSRAKSSDSPDMWPSHNLIVSSESHDNKDVSGENADGFAAKLTTGPGNVFRYDIAHHNSDDGWDLFTKPETGPIAPVTIEDSIAYYNGTLSEGTQMKDGDRNGFKLGGRDIRVDHIIRRNLAYDNGKHGFTYNRNGGSMLILDNVAIDNAARNFNFAFGNSAFSGNVSCSRKQSSKDKVTGSDDGRNIWWNGTNHPSCAVYGPRAFSWSFNADGSLKYGFQLT